MVGYQEFVGIVFDVSREKGASIDSTTAGGSVLTVAGEIWTDRKAELKDATEREAREIADEEVTVA